MKLSFKIEEQDFLDFHLFTASKSDKIIKKKRIAWVLLTLGSLMFAFSFFLNDNISMAIYFGMVALVCGLYYPKYFRWRYKKHYHKFIKENYSKRVGLLEQLELNKEGVFIKDKTGEGKINLSEIERVDETVKHFFLKITTGISLLIPKKQVQDVDGLRLKLKDSGLSVTDETNWTWN